MIGFGAEQPDPAGGQVLEEPATMTLPPETRMLLAFDSQWRTPARKATSRRSEFSVADLAQGAESSAVRSSSSPSHGLGEQVARAGRTSIDDSRRSSYSGVIMESTRRHIRRPIGSVLLGSGRSGAPTRSVPVMGNQGPSRDQGGLRFDFPPFFLPHETGAMASLALALPASDFERPLFADAVPVGDDPLTLWGSLSSGLVVPRSYSISAMPSADSSLSVLVTPESLGSREDPDLLECAAWRTLLKLDPQGLVANLLRLAYCAEFSQAVPEWHLHMVDMLDLPASRHAAVRQYVRSGRPLLYAKTIRWIAREIAAASHAHTRGYQAASTNSHQLDYFGRAWFKSWGPSLVPSAREITTAIWILHDCHGWSFDTQDPYETMASVTYGVQTARTPFSIVQRWLRIWQIQDDHPALNPRFAPSDLRDRYRDKIGAYPEHIILGCYWIAMTQARALGVHETPGNPVWSDEDWNKMTNHVFEPDQWDAIRRNLVVDFEAYAERCYEDVDGSYGGLGTLPYRDTLSCRTRPLIGFRDYLIPLSYSPTALMEQAVELHRWETTSAGASSFDEDMTRDAGGLLQAYIHDALRTHLPQHRILNPNEVECIAKDKWRSCDFVVVAPAGSTYLFIEATFDVLGAGIADGRAGSLDELRRKYNAKAEQIIQSMKHGPEIAEVIGALPPHRSVGLIVVERTLCDFPEYGRSIANLTRQDIRVIGIDEFELLLKFRESVAIPEIVYEWTRHRDRLPLGWYLSTNVSPSVSSGFTLAA